jgi:type IX secretion system PorP/SprF family membrane protein
MCKTLFILHILIENYAKPLNSFIMESKPLHHFLKVGILFFSIFILGTNQHSVAQDVHFTQFYHNPLLLNPAQTGLACNWRAGLNYRNQWASVTTPYTTFAGYFDVPVYFNKKRNSSLGLGLSVYNDQAGDGVLTTLEINPSIAFHLALGADNPKKYKLSIGVQPSLRNRKVDVSNLTFQAQFDGIEINPALPSMEHITNTNFSVFDLNSGIQFSAAPTDEVNFWVGGSLFHMLQPNEAFYTNASSVLPMRSMANAGARFIINPTWAILPNVLFMEQAKAKELNFGADFDYTYNPTAAEPFTLFAGPYYRWKDAFQILVGGEYKGYRVGLSYDINSSTLRTASHMKGGFELAIMYKSPCRLIPYHINKMFVCPRF